MSKICKKCGIQYDGQSCPKCGSTELFQGAPMQQAPGFQPNPYMQPQQPPKKKMHGCLLAFLIGFGIIVFLGIVGAVFGSIANNFENASDRSVTNQEVDNETDKKAEKEEAEPTEKPIEYIKYDVSEMMDDLDANALKAEKKYADQYVEITGRLSNIDSDGKYIDLMPTDEEFAFIGVQCYIKSDEQTDKVMEMSTDDTITLKGQITSIGEIMGYSLDIIEIE